MKESWKNNLRWIVMASLLLLTACNRDRQAVHVVEQYTCSMHPQVIQDKPGNCPICGMELVKRNPMGNEVKITEEINYLLKPANASVITSIKTIVPIQRVMETETEVKGIIAHDTRKVKTIAARFDGRIEKLYIKYNFQPIHKGQKIMEIYSPELITAQRELLYLLASDVDNATLIASSKQKLRLLGLSENQIEKFISSKQESYAFPVYSPFEGYISDHSMSEQNTPEMENRLTPTINSASGLLVREGTYVKAGQSIFTIVSHSDLWAEFDLYQRELPHVKLKDPVLITFDNTDGNIKAKIDFLQPFVKQDENLMKIRVYLPNAHLHYHAGQLITATLTSTSDSVMWIPTKAKLDLGTQDVVFIKRRNVFMPKPIVTGRQSGEWIEVLEGLEFTDSISYNAQFMVDSESFIKVKRRN